MKIRAFNMVEVMLAVVVIAVGLSSVFVLFPAGLTAHKTATADNSLADLAEFIFSSVKAQIDIECSGADEDGKKFEKGFWSKISDNDGDAGADVSDLTKWSVVDILKKGTASEDSKDEVTLLQNSEHRNVFWARQISGPLNNRYTDFSAIGRVYTDRGSSNSGLEKEYFYDRATGKMKSLDTTDKPRRFVLPLVLEISYPAEVDYERREKKYFRFEIFNDNYEPRPATP